MGWVTRLSPTYWTPYESGGPWAVWNGASWIPNVAKSPGTIALVPTGGWSAGFRALYMEVTHNLTGQSTLLNLSDVNFSPTPRSGPYISGAWSNSASGAQLVCAGWTQDVPGKDDIGVLYFYSTESLMPCILNLRLFELEFTSLPDMDLTFGAEGGTGRLTTNLSPLTLAVTLSGGDGDLIYADTIIEMSQTAGIPGRYPGHMPDWENDTFEVGLMGGGSGGGGSFSCVVQQAAWRRTDFATWELSVGSYVGASLTLSGVTVSEDPDQNQKEITWDTLHVTPQGGDIGPIYGVMIFDVSLPPKPYVGCFAFDAPFTLYAGHTLQLTLTCTDYVGSPIVDFPVYVCRACGAVWMGDDQMYRDPDRCPRCGRFAGPRDLRPAGGGW